MAIVTRSPVADTSWICGHKILVHGTRMTAAEAFGGVCHERTFGSPVSKCISLAKSCDCLFSASLNAVLCSSAAPALRRQDPVRKISRNGEYFEKLWRDLFSDPSQWWDNRLDKPNLRFPDFKHKRTGKGLWVIDGRNPPWVQSELPFIAPGQSIFSGAESFSKYNKVWQFDKTLKDFEQMRREGAPANGEVLVQVIQACAALHDLNEGRRVHQYILETDTLKNLYMSGSLVDMYAKCGSIDEAFGVFNNMSSRDSFAWNAIILGCVKCGEGLKARELFQQMKNQGFKPSRGTLMGLLNACASIGALEEGKRVHEQIIQSGFESDVYVASSLIGMYSKCGSLAGAWSVFCKMPYHDVVAWNTMILGFVKCGEGLNALELFQQMQNKGVEPNSRTLMGLLNACGNIGSLENGKRVHEEIIRRGFESDVYIASSLVDMYCKCGRIDDAQRVFNKMPTPGVVAWNSIISGCAKSGKGLQAIHLFQRMRMKGVEPNLRTLMGLLNACATIAALETGKYIHGLIIQRDYESNPYIAGSLVDMYVKCGSIDRAWKVFSKIQMHSVIVWTAMIMGFVKSGQGLEALDLFKRMQKEGVEPDRVTLIAALNACGSIAALEEGKRIHKKIVQSDWESDVNVSNSLIDMYCKCGRIEDARMEFDNMSARDVASWTAMIMGYAMHGLGKEAIELFEELSVSDCEIVEVTFICLLTACSHGGLVKEGMQYFERMCSVYGVPPIQEHYTCVVNILGRAGRLDEAEAIANTMPLAPSAATWISLLRACRIRGNVEMGKRASEKILDLDRNIYADGYVFLSNIYAAASDYKRKAMARDGAMKALALKQPGRSWIEVNRKVHSFVVNDSQHPQILQIHGELARLLEHLKKAGYVPDIRFAFQDSEEEKNLEHLCYHSEKLAITFGLITTPAGTPVRIVKNLWVCGDCHTAIKFISKIVQREITLRDANRFHFFKDGVCSCGDHW